MRLYPTKINAPIIGFLFFSILVILGCSKDSDLLLDSVINDAIVGLEEKEETETTTNTEEVTTTEEVVVTEEEVSSEESEVTPLENRTTSFSPTNDAHVQSGKGYNQSIIRLAEDSRTSYLMFDLSPISRINGIISEATLQFTIDSDNGNGNINVFKATSSDWSENDLTENNIPQIEIQIGTILKEYKLGDTQFIDLNVSSLQTEISTLILSHQNGDDLAFASKEHPSKIGPKLVITYEVIQGSAEVIIPEPIIIQEETHQEETIVNQDPIAIADASPSTGGFPLEVTFTGSNSTDDDSIVNYSWDFKDGTSATEANPTHTFSATGVYEVMLTITDNEGLTSSESVTITVNENPNEAPTAKASATPLTGEAPLDVSFNGSTSTDDVSIVKYEWDFKDGQNGNAANLDHTYTQPGTYQAELKVTDENGLSNTTSISIVVSEPTNEAPIATTSANTTAGVAPLNVQFTGTNSSDDKAITSYAWNFKDGSNASDANPSHTFTTAGTYVVELTVSDAAGLTHANTITIRVTEPVAENVAPIARTAANITAGDAPLAVQFTGSQSTDDKAITSYFWDFKDGTTSTNSNPSHTFTQAGNYVVALTVTDAQGESNTNTITITASAPVVNTPPGFYVATNGNSSNNGTSPTSPWSIEHAFSQAKAGNNIYVKAGNYGNKNLVLYTSGNGGNPIKFIGYTNSPGDLVSDQGSTFNYGETINSQKMPTLIGSSSTQGIAIHNHGSNVEFENFQITNYLTGLNSGGSNVLLKNIVTTNTGQQNNNNTNSGTGIVVSGNNTQIENCFVLNSNSQGINIKGANYCNVTNTSVYSDRASNPTGYYLLLSFGASNNVIQNCTVYRDKNADLHRGHGFVMKGQATNNIIKNSTTYNTGIEVNFAGVHSNLFENIVLNGSSSEDENEFTSGIRVINGAHDNVFRDITLNDCRYAINFHDFDDDFVGPNGDFDRPEGGHNNQFIRLDVNRARTIIGASSKEGFASTFSNNNTIEQSSFSNITGAAFFSYHDVNGTKFIGCDFENIPDGTLVYELNGGSFPIDFINCTFTNVGFSIPN